jgi:hypothetical protein
VVPFIYLTLVADMWVNDVRYLAEPEAHHLDGFNVLVNDYTRSCDPNTWYGTYNCRVGRFRTTYMWDLSLEERCSGPHYRALASALDAGSAPSEGRIVYDGAWVTALHERWSDWLETLAYASEMLPRVFQSARTDCFTQWSCRAYSWCAPLPWLNDT